jgi:ABC-type multidrug transport system fused ATPase/permease subunit
MASERTEISWLFFRYPLIMLPIAVRTTLSAHESFAKLDKFLQQPELEPPAVEKEPIDSDPRIRIFIENADFSYHGGLEPTLRFLTMKVKQGDVVAIVGDVGAGKSSVLAAILGQMSIRKDAGSKRFVRGSMAYVPDDAWLSNATLMDNILFGNPYIEQRYQDVIHVCALKKDLEWLSNGDQTEIGDRGVNLSPGQRQRVSLARAVYSNADIILLDDPLRYALEDGFVESRNDALTFLILTASWILQSVNTYSTSAFGST